MRLMTSATSLDTIRIHHSPKYVFPQTHQQIMHQLSQITGHQQSLAETQILTETTQIL